MEFRLLKLNFIFLKPKIDNPPKKSIFLHLLNLKSGDAKLNIKYSKFKSYLL